MNQLTGNSERSDKSMPDIFNQVQGIKFTISHCMTLYFSSQSCFPLPTNVTLFVMNNIVPLYTHQECSHVFTP